MYWSFLIYAHNSLLTISFQKVIKNSGRISPKIIMGTKLALPVLLSKRLSTSIRRACTVIARKPNANGECILDSDSKNDTRSIRKKKTVISKEISEYLSSKKSLLHIRDVLPNKFLRKRRGNSFHDALYVVDKDVAQQFVDVIKLVWNLKDDDVVLEANPGLGLISTGLLEAGVKKLILFESCKNFDPMLNELQSRHPKEVTIIGKNIFSLWKLAFQDKMDNGTRVAQILDQLPKRNWDEDPALKILGALPTIDFIRHLILNIAFQTGIIMQGRPELYLALSHSTYLTLTCGPEDGFSFYRSGTVLFQLFFEIELLNKLPRKAYFPWEVQTKHISILDSEFLYLVKIVPRKDLYDNVAPMEKLQPLWYFVRHHLFKRNNRVIPALEQWIPGCGTRLIFRGMSIFTKFGNLNPQEILQLFHEFSSWPEYPHSPFQASMEALFLKMEQSGDEDIIESESDIEEVESSSFSVKSLPDKR